MEKEIFNYSRYAITKKQGSKYVTGELIDVEVGVSCPVCGRQNKPIEHGKQTKCECSLCMERLGNALIIWRE